MPEGDVVSLVARLSKSALNQASIAKQSSRSTSIRVRDPSRVFRASTPIALRREAHLKQASEQVTNLTNTVKATLRIE